MSARLNTPHNIWKTGGFALRQMVQTTNNQDGVHQFKEQSPSGANIRPVESFSKCETIPRKMTLICMKMKLHAELIFIFAPKMFLGTDFFKTCHALITSRQLCILWTLRVLLFHWLAAFWVDISVWEGLVNEDTLLPMMFLGLRKLGNICCRHKMFLNKVRKIFFVPDTKFVSQQMLRARANGETFVSEKMCLRQCVLVC